MASTPARGLISLTADGPLRRVQTIASREKCMSKMATSLVKRDLTMKAKVIGYWATTSIIAFELLLGGLTDLVHGGTSLVAGEPVANILTHLGYPVYVLTILGV